MEAIHQQVQTLIMSEQEESALWRKRFFEVQAGMERYLTETYGSEEIAEWLPVKAEILRGLDAPERYQTGVQVWKERFFKTQALLEKYVADHHGLEDLGPWTLAISQIFKYTEPNLGGGAADIVFRLAKQAHCYRSEYVIAEAGNHYARLQLKHCAIWDYREVARQRGVQLTLASPCTYCTKATVANARAKGFRATFTLHETASGHGCTWEIDRVAEYENPILYSRASGLRQRKDAEWVLGLIPNASVKSCLDLGCGNGDFLSQLLTSGRITQRIAGLDRSEAMIMAAQAKMTPLAGDVDLWLQQGDILNPPRIGGKFDLVTMLAVQHWLYPREADAYRWIGSLLDERGVFCLTTYHPVTDARCVGGSDEVVLEAMDRIGAPAEFPEGFLPIGRRARPARDVAPLLERDFHIVATATREAVTRAESAEQYSRFHVATFGSYYSQLLPAEDRSRFVEAIGHVAMDRMRRLGYVTNMAVQCWVCQRKPFEFAPRQ